MVAYCNNCRRYVNHYCETCSNNFGVKVCERYGCGGRMLCSICGGNNLTSKREEITALYDFSKEQIKANARRGAASEIEARYFDEKNKREKGRDRRGSQEMGTGFRDRHCSLCGYRLQYEWQFCPECGVSLLTNLRGKS